MFLAVDSVLMGSLCTLPPANTVFRHEAQSFLINVVSSIENILRVDFTSKPESNCNQNVLEITKYEYVRIWNYGCRRVASQSLTAKEMQNGK